MSVTTVRNHQGHEIPEAGTYAIDAAHTNAEFVVRHLMISKVRGRFTAVTGEIRIADDPVASAVEVVIEAASITTGDDARDEHLRGPDFLDVEQFPTLTFRSAEVAPARAGRWAVTGDLTIRGVSRPVVLDVEFDGGTTDPWGGFRLGFSARAELDREDFGLTWNQALEAGGVLVGRKVAVELEVQAVREEA